MHPISIAVESVSRPTIVLLVLLLCTNTNSVEGGINFGAFDYTENPSTFPTVFPSISPTGTPTFKPTQSPSVLPTKSSQPSFLPTSYPSITPSIRPSPVPSRIPTSKPSQLPSYHPSEFPTIFPSESISKLPSSLPTWEPSALPSIVPTDYPSKFPSLHPSQNPIVSFKPSHVHHPSAVPSSNPTFYPLAGPTRTPSSIPSYPPSSPSLISSNIPSKMTTNPGKITVGPTAPSKSPLQQNGVPSITAAPSKAQWENVSYEFLIEYPTAEKKSDSYVDHFEQEAYNLVTADCSLAADEMDIESVTFIDQSLSLDKTILILRFSINGREKIDRPKNKDFEQRVVSCFETKYNQFIINVAAIGSAGIDPAGPEENNSSFFSTLTIAIIGGTAFVVLVTMLSVYLLLRKRRKTQFNEAHDEMSQSGRTASKRQMQKRRRWDDASHSSADDDSYSGNVIYGSSSKIIHKRQDPKDVDLKPRSKIKTEHGTQNRRHMASLSPLARKYDLDSPVYGDNMEDKKYGDVYRNNMRSLADSLTTRSARYNEGNQSQMNREEEIDQIMHTVQSMMNDMETIMNDNSYDTPPAKDERTFSISESQNLGLNVPLAMDDFVELSGPERETTAQRRAQKFSIEDSQQGNDHQWLNVLGFAGQPKNKMEEEEDLRSTTSGKSRFSRRMEA